MFLRLYVIHSQPPVHIAKLVQLTMIDYEIVSTLDRTEYDDFGRIVTNVFYETTNAASPLKTVSYSYDTYGRMTSYDDGTTSGAFSNEDTNRRRTVAVDFGGFTKSYTYNYDALGRKIGFIGPNGITNTYAHDVDNRLTSVTIPDEGTISFSANQFGLPSGVTFPGGTVKTYGYDALMSIVTNTAKDAAENDIMSRVYSRNNVQNITGQQTEHGNYSYGYDDIYQLTTVDHPVFTNEFYTYDSVGNRLSATTDTHTASYSVNDLNQYTSVTSVVSARDFSYDANGNDLIHYRHNDDGNITTNYLVWNIENRLETILDASSNIVATYYYDPFGRRLKKEVHDGGNIVTSYYLYADEGLIAEFDGEGNELRGYGYIPGSLWMSGPLYMREGDSYYYYLNDHLGSPQKIVNKNGAMVWSMVSEAFGEAMVWEGSTVTNNLRFSSQYYDAESGLHYNTHRYYIPSLGRYNRRDPIGEFGLIFYDLESGRWRKNDPVWEKADIEQRKVPLYLFALNNPERELDVLGLYATTFDENGRPCYRCGPNITVQLKQVISKVRRDFAGWSRTKRWRKCKSLTFVFTAPWSWDIDELSPTHRDRLNYTFPNCPSGKDCWNTVEVDGGCFMASRVNYVLFGTMGDLCGWTLADTIYLVSYWKTMAYGPESYDEDTVAWSNAGWHGWPSSRFSFGATPPTQPNRQKCELGCGRPSGSFSYLLGPIQGRRGRK